MKMTKELWLEKNGFGADGLTWCIFGEDTYASSSKNLDVNSLHF